MKRRKIKTIPMIDQMRLAVATAEREFRVANVGTEIPGTGQTVIKKRLAGLPPIAQLIENYKIGPVERSAATEILTACMAKLGRFWVRGASLDRIDGGRAGEIPWTAYTAHAVARYDAWANYWSRRSKDPWDTSGPTLRIVYSAVVEEWSFATICDDEGLSPGTVRKLLVAGLRDYAARAGWITGRVAAKWLADDVPGALSVAVRAAAVMR